jgi:2,4-dienoyl-CoA reductase (NADPH2)
MVLVGSTVVNYPLGTCIQGQMRSDDDKFIPGFTEIARVVHKYDCPVILQILHAGAWHGIFSDGQTPVSSSDMSAEELQRLDAFFGLENRGLTVPEIKEIQGMFLASAERARQAGFDGVEINVGSCHLGNSFLSPAWNKRQDEYGIDTLENRSRFAVEIIREVKKRLGEDFVVGVLMNGAEFGIDNGIKLADSQGVARLLEKAGVDYIQVRGFGYGVYNDLNEPESIFYPGPPQPMAPPLDGSHYGAGIMVPLAAAIKQAVSVPVMAIGRMDAELGEQAIKEGKADYIAMQRRLIADPELPNKVAAGRLDDIAPCTGCLGCFGFMERREHVRCRINAAMGGTRDYAIDPALVKKKVVVVGGGPAGMEAARVAAIRGHRVVLYEKERRLGGLLPVASLVKNPELENLQDIINYLSDQINRLGVDLKIGKKFDATTAAKEKPDVIITAVGGRAILPDIPGVEGKNVIGLPQLHEMMKKYLRYLKPGAIRSMTKLWMPIGKKVVIIGGGLHGGELAEFLVKAGREVTMVDRADTLQDARMPMVLRVRLSNWLSRHGVTMLTGVKYEGITAKGLTVTTKEGQQRTIEADTVIPVVPLAPNKELAESLKGKVPEVYAIGNCSQDGLIIDAIADGYRVAREVI